MGTIVLLSGGMDSTVLLALLLKRSFNIQKAVSFSYGSSHNQWEMLAARRVADYYGLQREVFYVESVFSNFRSALLNKQAIPEGHYQEETMRQTVVPGRNSIFISIAAGYAESIGARKIAIAAHAGDHHIYPDCRPDYLSMMAAAVRLGSGDKVELLFPFQSIDKTEILKKGLELDAPLGLTRTCYKDQPTACGRCGSCQERLEAFASLGEEDPLEYESRELLSKT